MTEAIDAGGNGGARDVARRLGVGGEHVGRSCVEWEGGVVAARVCGVEAATYRYSRLGRIDR